MKLLSTKYKTWEGARNRAYLENALAKGEFERGAKARLYCYSVVEENGVWRVARAVAARA